MTDTVSLDTNPTTEEQPTVSLDTGVPGAGPMSPNTAASRSNRISFGLSQHLSGKTQEEIFSDLVSGKEAELRRQAAADIDAKDQASRVAVIKNLAANRDGMAGYGKLSVQDRDKINAYIRTIQDKKPTDPTSVVETKFADQWFKYLDIQPNMKSNTATWDWTDTVFGKASVEMPGVVEHYKGIGTEVVARQQVVQSLIEDIEDEAKQNTLANWADTLKLWVPFYEQYKLRNASGDVSFFKGLLGTNLSEQATQAHMKNFDTFKAEVHSVANKLRVDNPYLALTWLQYVKGMSSSEEELTNLSSAIDFTFIPAGKLTAATVRGLRAMKDVAGTTANVLRAARKPNPTVTDLVAATGDAGEAAVQKVTQNILAEAKGTPNLTSKALDALTSDLKVAREELGKGDFSRVGQELVNEISQKFDMHIEGLVKDVSEMSRVQRIPEAMLSEETSRKLRDAAVAELAPAQRNSFHDVKGPFVEPVSTTIHFEHWLGRAGGEGFVNDLTLRKHAKALGISEYRVEKIGESKFIVVTKPLIETQNIIKDGLIETYGFKDPKNWADDTKSLLVGLRTPDEIFDEIHRGNRKAATFNSSILYERVKDMVKDIAKISYGPLSGRLGRLEVEHFNPEIRTTFTTAKGSEYTIQKDGTTIRNKAIRSDPGHEGDFGMKPPSSKTVYLDDMDANLLAPPQGKWRFIDHGDGTVSLATPNAKAGWGISPSARNVPYDTAPSVGKTPLELFSPGETLGVKSFRDAHFGNKITEVAHNTVEPTTATKITKSQRYDDFVRVLKATRDIRDPKTGELGYLFDTIGELDNFYYQLIKRAPDPDEIRAFWSFKALMGTKSGLERSEVYKAKSRLGAEAHAVVLTNENGERILTKRFDAIMHKDFPTGVGDYPVALMGDKVGEEQVKMMSSLSQKQKDALKERGAVVLEILDQGDLPLKGFGNIKNERIRYVVSNSVDTAPMSFNQKIKGKNGIFDYEYEDWIKQGRITRDEIGKTVRYHYEGDAHAFPVSHSSQGVDISEKMNRARGLLKEGKVTEAKQVVDDELHIPWITFNSWFRPDKEGKIRFNLDEPFQVAKKNQYLIDIDKDMPGRYLSESGATSILKDATKDGPLSRRNKLHDLDVDAYEAMTLKDVGTAGKPVYDWQPSKMIDPINTMHRALTSIINSGFLDDYKTFAIERWIAKWGKYLDVSAQELRDMPNYHFYTAKNLADMPVPLQALMKTEKYQIEQLLKVSSDTDVALHSVAQRLSDAIYQKKGAEAAGSKQSILSMPWMLQNLTEPGKFLRAMTYHFTMGFMNPVQMLVNSMTYSTVFGIAGARAVPGSLGGMMHQITRINKNPAIIDKLDEYASKITFGMESRWLPGELKEAHTELSRTGFGYVGREHTLYENVTPKLVSNGVQTALDFMTTFVKGADRNIRFASWYTAFREFRDANPLKKITDTERNMILDRADDLSVNMSVASKSILQKGVMEFPAQFMSYNMRLFELMSGKRLTITEKARLLAVHSAVYGLPAVTGYAIYPWGDKIREVAQEHGYTVGDNFMADTLMNGLPAAMGAMVTGEWYNVSQRFGDPGITIIRDALSSDKPIAQVLMGAAGTQLGRMFSHADPFWHWSQGMLYGKQYPLTVDAVYDVFRDISTFNQWYRLLAAVNNGEWLTRNDQVLDSDVSISKAIGMTVTGLQTQQMADVYNLSQSVKHREEFTKYIEKEYVKEMTRGYRAASDRDYEQAEKYFQKASALVVNNNYPLDRMPALWSMANEPNTTLITKINKSFFTKNSPFGKEEMLLNTLRKKQEIQNRNRQ